MEEALWSLRMLCCCQQFSCLGEDFLVLLCKNKEEIQVRQSQRPVLYLSVFTEASLFCGEVGVFGVRALIISWSEWDRACDVNIHETTVRRLYHSSDECLKLNEMPCFHHLVITSLVLWRHLFNLLVLKPCGCFFPHIWPLCSQNILPCCTLWVALPL